jgi:hypothetical protein
VKQSKAPFVCNTLVKLHPTIRASSSQMRHTVDLKSEI